MCRVADFDNAPDVATNRLPTDRRIKAHFHQIYTGKEPNALYKSDRIGVDTDPMGLRSTATVKEQDLQVLLCEDKSKYKPAIALLDKALTSRMSACIVIRI